MKNYILTAVAALAIGIVFGKCSAKQSATLAATKAAIERPQIDFTEVAVETDNGTKFGRVLCVRTEDEQGAITSDKKSDISEYPNNVGRLIGTVNGNPVTVVVEW